MFPLSRSPSPRKNTDPVASARISSAQAPVVDCNRSLRCTAARKTGPPRERGAQLAAPCSSGHNVPAHLFNVFEFSANLERTWSNFIGPRMVHVSIRESVAKERSWGRRVLRCRFFPLRTSSLSRVPLGRTATHEWSCEDEKRSECWGSAVWSSSSTGGGSASGYVARGHRRKTLL